MRATASENQMSLRCLVGSPNGSAAHYDKKLVVLSPVRGVMFIAPNALYDSKPAPLGAERECETVAAFRS